MKEGPQISFIIPIYNNNFLEFKKCIGSVRKLNNISYEIIVIDDGSRKENSKKYAALLKNNNERYIRTQNQGVSSARNLGLRQAKGKYVSFIDADDEIIASTLVNYSWKTQPELVIYNVKIKMTNSNVIQNFDLTNLNSKKPEAKDLLKYSLKDGLMNWSVGKLYLKDFIKRNNIKFDDKLATGEDLKFVNDVLSTIPKIFYINSPLYIYHLDRNTEIKRKIYHPEQSLNDAMNVYNIRTHIIKELSLPLHYNLELKQNLINWVFDIYTLLIWNHIKINSNLLNKMQIIVKNAENLSDKKFSFKRWTIKNDYIPMVYFYMMSKNLYHFFKPDKF